MIFDQLFKRSRLLNENTKSLNPFRPWLSKEESARLSLEAANKLIANKKHKKALKTINASLQNNISSNQLLFKKAYLLLKSNQHKEARAILHKLANLENKPKLAYSAQKLLKNSKIRQHNDATSLLNSLHAKAREYQWKPKELPNRE